MSIHYYYSEEDSQAENTHHARFRSGSLYTKVNVYPMADVPLPFWSTILQLATKSQTSACFEANLERMYAAYPNKKVFRKYINILLEADQMLQIGKRAYMINPIYAHRGSQTNTEKAIDAYEAEKEAQALTGGRTPWIHDSVSEPISELLRTLAFNTTHRPPDEDPESDLMRKLHALDPGPKFKTDTTPHVEEEEDI